MASFEKVIALSPEGRRLRLAIPMMGHTFALERRAMKLPKNISSLNSQPRPLDADRLCYLTCLLYNIHFAAAKKSFRTQCVYC